MASTLSDRACALAKAKTTAALRSECGIPPPPDVPAPRIGAIDELVARHERLRRRTAVDSFLVGVGLTGAIACALALLALVASGRLA